MVGLLISGANKGRKPTEVIQEFATDAAGKERLNDLVGWADAMFTTAHVTVVSVMKGHSGSPEERILAAARITVEPANASSPEELFYAHFLILQGLVPYPWGLEIIEEAERQIRAQWLDKINNARFSLRTPRLTEPAIRAACGSEESGLTVAATILLAAEPAVSVNLSASMRDDVLQWSGR